MAVIGVDLRSIAWRALTLEIAAHIATTVGFPHDVSRFGARCTTIPAPWLFSYHLQSQRTLGSGAALTGVLPLRPGVLGTREVMQAPGAGTLPGSARHQTFTPTIIPPLLNVLRYSICTVTTCFNGAQQDAQRPVHLAQPSQSHLPTGWTLALRLAVCHALGIRFASEQFPLVQLTTHCGPMRGDWFEIALTAFSRS